MSTHTDSTLAQQYLTIADAARQAAVHPSTIRRWIDQGMLPAYRLGHRRLGVKPADLAAIVVPRGSSRAQATPASMNGARHMTKAEQRRALTAMEELFRYADEVAARHGGPFTPPSWVLINEARDQRTRDLMGDTDE